MGGPDTNGLINPAEFPITAADLDVDKIQGAGTAATSLGTKLDTTTDAIQRVWSGLQQCYHAPEQHHVYRIMMPATIAADQVKERMDGAAKVTSTYASAVEDIKPRLENLETEATTFRELALQGHERWGYKPIVMQAGTAISSIPSWGVIHEEWHEHTPYVERNSELLGEYQQLMTELSEAADTCSSGLVALMSPTAAEEFRSAVAAAERKAEEEGRKNPPEPPVWGFARAESRNCGEQVGDGVTNVFWDTVHGVGGLFGYNPETGPGDGEHAKRSWLGIVDALGSLAMFGTVTMTGSLLHAGGHQNAVTEFLANRHMTATQVLAGFVAIDTTSSDPFATWKTAPGQGITESVINIGSIFLGGAGIGRAGVKAALGTARGARIANALGHVLEVKIPGGQWLQRSAVRVYSLSRLDLEGALRGTRLEIGKHTPEFSTPARKPVSHEVFPPERTPPTETGGGGHGSGGKGSVPPHAGSPESPHSPRTPSEPEAPGVRGPRPKPDDWPENGLEFGGEGRHAAAVGAYTGPHSSRLMNTLVNDLGDLSPAQARRLLAEQGDQLPRWIREQVESISRRPGGVTAGLDDFNPSQFAETARHVDAMIDVIDNAPVKTGTVHGGKWVDEDALAALQPGTTYQPNSFFSTSTNKQTALTFALDAEHVGRRSVLFRLESKTGVSLRGITSSDEIVFRPGTRFRVSERRPLSLEGLPLVERMLLGENPVEIVLEEIP